jgi:hypothetical protein
MKQQIPIWVGLTFLMIFLVVFAGFIFALQGRDELRSEVATLEISVTDSADSLNALAVTATAEAAIRADAVATRDVLSAELDANQSALEEAQRERVVVETIVVEARDTRPTIAVFAPESEVTIRPNQPIELLVSVSDPLGVAQITVMLNDETFNVYNAERETLYSIAETWQSETEGTYQFAFSAINTDGIASETLTTTIIVEDREARLRTVVSEVQVAVEQLRGITATQPITLTIYTQAELRANFETLFLDEITPEETRRDVIELHAFDFVDLDYDLYSVLVDLYSDSVLGFYDPETKELVVVSDDGELNPSEELTLVHEITHALQDQAFGLDLEIEDSEAAFARRALAEGDATLLQQRYVVEGFMSEADFAALMVEAAAEPPPDFSQIPAIIIEQQYFPYDAGAQFVQSLFTAGGYPAVDAAWETLPVSSEQIIHPESYAENDLPELITLLPLTTTLGLGWEFIGEDTLGEFVISVYFEQQLSERVSRDAAAGWGGDRYVVYWNETAQDIVMALATEWDTEEDSAEFLRVSADYLAAKYDSPPEFQDDGSQCYRSDDVTCIYERDGRVTLIRAPSFALITAIARDIR